MSNCVVFLGHSVLSDKSANLRSPTAALTSSKLLVGSLDSTDFSSQSLKCRESKILKSQVDFNITKSPAEAVCDDFKGCEALSARSYLSGNDRSDFSQLPHLSPQAELLNFNIKDTQ